MAHINKIIALVVCVLVFACANSNDGEASNTLKSYLNATTFETGAVIACAATDKDTGDVLTFFYPVIGAKNIRLYETNNAQVDNSNYSNYTQVFLESEPVFNGYLRRFSQKSLVEKWIIVSFEFENEIKISNPIRSKQFTKPTLWTDIVTINQDQPNMPLFSWTDNVVGDNAIYFQIVSDAQDNLLSGTYTNQNQFQYYKLDNVVLNVTVNTPPSLQLNTPYNFTLMDVSLDNWVNVVTLNKNFTNK